MFANCAARLSCNQMKRLRVQYRNADMTDAHAVGTECHRMEAVRSSSEWHKSLSCCVNARPTLTGGCAVAMGTNALG